MRILITGGHFSPAHALINELKKRGHEVVVAGRKHPFEGDLSESFEYRISKNEDVPFYEIKTGRYQRKFSTYTLISLLRTPSGFIQALHLIKKIKPDVVLTFGGYIGLPLSYAAASLKVPVVLHEQTQKAGLASKAIAKIAARICISHEASGVLFPKNKVVLTGNPLRKEIFTVSKKINIPANLPLIYITGGSAGSHFINELILRIAKKLLRKYVLIHQTGDSLKFDDYSKILKFRSFLSEDEKKRYIIKKFIDPSEIGFVFKNADLIIARSGANTVDEVRALSKHALLIPLPWGQHSEQLENAKYLKALGLGDYIEEDQAKEEAVLQKIEEMFNAVKKDPNIDESFKNISQNAASKIADVVEEISNNG